MDVRSSADNPQPSPKPPALAVLQIEETAASLFGRHGTGVVAPKHAVSVAGNHPVAPVANRPGYESQQESSQSPEYGSPFACRSRCRCWRWCWCALCGSGSQTRTGRAQLGFSQLPEDKDDRIGPSQQLLVGLVGIDHNVHRIEVLSIRPMPGQNAPSQRTLQRGEAEDARRIAPQNELDEPVAQPADAVVEQDGVHWRVTSRTLALLEIPDSLKGLAPQLGRLENYREFPVVLEFSM